MRRRGKGAKGLPLAEVRELMRDGRVHVDLGVVFTPDGGSHYYKDTANGRSKVMVEVETSSGLDLTCRLATRPTWYIPTPGTVVIVAIPMGELEHCPSIVGILDSGSAPDDVGTDKTLMASEVQYVAEAPAIKLNTDNGAQVHLLPDGTTRIGSGEAVNAMILGTTRTASETTYLQNLVQQFEGLATTCQPDPNLSPLATGFTLIKNTIQTFLDALPATLSQKVKGI